ncbi:Cryptococcal mannosyltransferase 1 [Aureococcus anophagefferens]|nr:Cryptococcal mannosyltransferase 1 [Aureococcus anophagefferens]
MASFEAGAAPGVDAAANAPANEAEAHTAMAVDRFREAVAAVAARQIAARPPGAAAPAPAALRVERAAGAEAFLRAAAPALLLPRADAEFLTLELAAAAAAARRRATTVECQRRHWSVHKVVCQARAVAPAPAPPRAAPTPARIEAPPRAAILGVARDCARHVGPSLRALERVAEKLFDGAAAWIVFENDSARGWLEGLDYVVVADLDDVNADIDVAGAAAALWHLEVGGADVATANQPRTYYDLWALRTEAFDVNSWVLAHRRRVVDEGLAAFFPVARPFPAGYDLRRDDVIRDEVRFSTRAPPVPVLSAFGGLAIYRAAKLKDRRDAAKLAPARYDGADAAMAPPACHPLWSGQDCEHVAFHAALRAYHGGALAVCVHPRLLNCPGQAAREPNLLRA